jgi:hypothetical protein
MASPWMVASVITVEIRSHPHWRTPATARGRSPRSAQVMPGRGNCAQSRYAVLMDGALEAIPR